MPNNYDLITVGASGDFNCTELTGCLSVLTTYYMRKAIATPFTDSLTATNTVWDSNTNEATLPLGTLSSTGVSFLKVLGSTDDDALLEVRSNDGSVTTIIPDQVMSEELRSVAGAFKATNTLLTSPAGVFSGDIDPDIDHDAGNTRSLGSTSKRWSKLWVHDLDLAGTASLAGLSLSGDLSVGGNLTVTGSTTMNGAITLGNASGDAVTVTGTATFTQEAEFNGGINCDGALTMEGNHIVSTSGNISTTTGTVTSSVGTFTNGTVATAPSADTGIVRRTDVNVGTGVNLTNIIPKITVAGGYITAIAASVASDIPLHASRHHSSSIDATVEGADKLEAHQVGAIARTGPVMSNPLKLQKVGSSSYAYSSSNAEDYFKVIASTESPANYPSGPAGQIIIRKAEP